MLSRVALPVLMWSISAAGGEEAPADQPVIERGRDLEGRALRRGDRDHLQLVSIVGPERIDEAGRNFKVSVSSRF